MHLSRSACAAIEHTQNLFAITPGNLLKSFLEGIAAGVARGLQNRWGTSDGPGGFDSHSLPPNLHYKTPAFGLILGFQRDAV